MMGEPHPESSTGLPLRGGSLFHSSSLGFEAADVAIAEGRVVAIGTDLDPGKGSQVIEVDNGIVCPGLIDTHTHFFSGQDLGRNADDVGPASGFTTFVDCGGAGAHLWGAM